MNKELLDIYRALDIGDWTQATKLAREMQAQAIEKAASMAICVEDQDHMMHIAAHLRKTGSFE